MKKLLLLILILAPLSSFNAHSRGYWTAEWTASARFSGGSGQYLPFWAHTGTNGVVPSASGGVLTAGVDVSCKVPSGFFFESGVNLAGWAAEDKVQGAAQVRGMVDRLYVGAGWKMLRVDVGMLPHHKELGNLSITGGNMMWSSNARNIPGVNLKSDWIYPLKWFAFRGNLAHYKMIDSRSVQGTLLHDKSLEVRFDITSGLAVCAGLEHIAQWGGVSRKYGPQPSSFSDYVRVFFAQSGGRDASVSDQTNVIGNHLGREFIRMEWKDDRFGLVFQYDKPFEDGSGVRFQNFPDGVWTLKYDLKDRKAFVTEVVYEFINTTWQSGPLHERPATEEEMKGQDPSDPFYGYISLKGRDDYFNNSMYMSGWTNHGRVIGLPLLGGLVYGDDGVVTEISCNRVRAHHLGVGGNLNERCPYAFKSTYSRNYGRYGQQDGSMYSGAPWQLSMALEVGVPGNMTRLPVDFWIGAYADLGQMYPDTFGLSVKIIYCGSRTF